MSTLDSLIRVNKWKLDEQRRQLGELPALLVEPPAVDADEAVERAQARPSRIVASSA